MRKKKATRIALASAIALWAGPILATPATPQSSPQSAPQTAAPQTQDGIPVYVPIPEIYQQCDTYKAPPILLVAVSNVESGRNPWVINDNTLLHKHLPNDFYLHNAQQAIAKATQLLGEGHNIDMGIMQINSQWVQKGRYTVDQLFNPCDNIGAGSWVFIGGWNATSGVQPLNNRMLESLAIYNCGHPYKNIQCNYGVKVLDTIGIHATVPGYNCHTSVPIFKPWHNYLNADHYTSTLKRRLDDATRDVSNWGKNVWDQTKQTIGNAKSDIESWTGQSNGNQQEQASHHSKANSTGNTIKGILLIVLILLLIVLLIYFGIIPLGSLAAWAATQVGTGILSLAASAGKA
ncbi:transglycosylase SLT domain-containing protein [Candidatus Igneacidithiobacillus taiwanensis]|uniref:transglycosylase SLT domain-containing protein n=1 Tax=Candidatus Igneacidithiobacillus taiwanensis TaxID=1945924 RepID=UPI00289733D3|nr:transglycosylase SLT domain-containing protein [Candidatus Igneacidithiobacillus taiwanensis]